MGRKYIYNLEDLIHFFFIILTVTHSLLFVSISKRDRWAQGWRWL